MRLPQGKQPMGIYFCLPVGILCCVYYGVAMEELRIFLNSLSSDEQRMFACECGTSIGYLRKALSKGQVLGASLCVLIERASNGEVTRQQLRPFDWMNIWPELEDTKTLTQPLSRSLIHENQA